MDFSGIDNVQVFAVIMNETAGSSSRSPHAVDYNSSHSLNATKYEDNIVYTNVRRFIVVRTKREFCFAW
jgi:3,4-dihydroxy-2-butanone 4-phosphate synthase